MSPLGYAEPEELAGLHRVRRVRRRPLHDRLDRLDGRRHHRVSGEPMITEPDALWELIEAARPRPRPTPSLGDRRGRAHAHRRASTATRPSAPRPGSHALGIGEGTSCRGSCRPGSSRSCSSAALARLGAVQNPMLPIYREREVRLHHRADRRASCSSCRRSGAASTTRTMARDDRGGQPGLEVLVVDRALPDGDPSTLPPPAPRRRTPADAPVRWVFYTSGTTADPKGARHTDPTVKAAAVGMVDGARGHRRRPHRAACSRSPTSAASAGCSRC